jgi:hypothetical protein
MDEFVRNPFIFGGYAQFVVKAVCTIVRKVVILQIFRVMSPNTSPTSYRDRARYMVEYRENNGSGRDCTLVECSCGKQVYKYAL